MTNGTIALDHIDSLNSNISRTKAVINTLSFDDNFQGMLVEDMAAMLQIIYEAMEDAQKATSELSKHIK